MRIQPHSDMLSLVLVGAFNPAIFHPAWFGMNGLLGRIDVETAEIAVTHPEFSQFKAGRLGVQVGLNQFTVTCPTAYHGLAKDLVTGTFGQHLTHTPVLAVGINRQVHFDAGTFEVRECVGNRLAPKEPWGDWGDALAGEQGRPDTHGGMMSLVMRQAKRPDEYRGYIQVDVQPSVQPGLLMTGIYAQTNDHYDLADGAAAPGCRRMLEVIETKWDWSIDNSAAIIDRLMALTETCGMKP